MTKKIAINKCFGGFGLSLKALEMLARLKGHGKLHHYQMDLEDRNYKKVTTEEAEKGSTFFQHTLTADIGNSLYEYDFYELAGNYFYSPKYERHDADLIEVIETLGSGANGPYSDLEIFEIPKETVYQIEEYDGNEWIAEQHKTWS